MSAPAEFAPRRAQSPAERAMELAWKVQLSEDTRQVKLRRRPDAAERVATAQAKRAKRAAKRVRA
jgi:hypothetical protein